MREIPSQTKSFSINCKSLPWLRWMQMFLLQTYGASEPSCPSCLGQGDTDDFLRKPGKSPLCIPLIVYLWLIGNFWHHFCASTLLPYFTFWPVSMLIHCSYSHLYISLSFLKTPTPLRCSGQLMFPQFIGQNLSQKVSLVSILLAIKKKKNLFFPLTVDILVTWVAIYGKTEWWSRMKNEETRSNIFKPHKDVERGQD